MTGPTLTLSPEMKARIRRAIGAREMSDETQDIVVRAEELLAGIDLGDQETLTWAAWWAAENETENYGSHPNVRFVDAAPQLVRELVAEVRRLRAALRLGTNPDAQGTAAPDEAIKSRAEDAARLMRQLIGAPVTVQYDSFMRAFVFSAPGHKPTTMTPDQISHLDAETVAAISARYMEPFDRTGDESEDAK